MDFGDHEGLHFDGLPLEQKKEISDPNFSAPSGESWSLVKVRCEAYFARLTLGNHLIFTHGGPITKLLYNFGIH